MAGYDVRPAGETRKSNGSCLQGKKIVVLVVILLFFPPGCFKSEGMNQTNKYINSLNQKFAYKILLIFLIVIKKCLATTHYT